MRRIAVDMDEVLADFVNPFRKVIKNKWGKDLQREDITRYNFSNIIGVTPEEFKEVIVDLQTSEWYRTLPVMPYAQEVMNMLQEEGNLVDVITNRACAKDSLDWLDGNFIRYNNFLISKDKKSLYKSMAYDVVIDDCPDYLIDADSLEILTLAYDAPWNRHTLGHNIERVHNWIEIYDRLGQKYFDGR